MCHTSDLGQKTVDIDPDPNYAVEFTFVSRNGEHEEDCSLGDAAQLRDGLLSGVDRSDLLCSDGLSTNVEGDGSILGLWQSWQRNHISAIKYFCSII